MLERSAHDAQIALDRIKKAIPNGEFDTTTEAVSEAFRNATQKLADAARSQASAIATTAYTTGERAAKTMQSEITENWIDIALGGVIGFAVGYLVGRRP
jgi:ElaB/YqjD/DUF883 family membrane-anchored ribosome-binding protein